MTTIDLFSGTGSATIAFKEAGEEVIEVDVLRGIDIKDFHPPPARFVWASPPCTEYSLGRAGGKWPTYPSRYLWDQALRCIDEAKPKYWIIENVCGAQKMWGRPRFHWGPYYLWGWFPPLKGLGHCPGKDCDRIKDPAKRAMIPRALADAVYQAVTP